MQLTYYKPHNLQKVIKILAVPKLGRKCTNDHVTHFASFCKDQNVTVKAQHGKRSTARMENKSNMSSDKFFIEELDEYHKRK